MTNKISAAIAATVITLGGLGLLACAPEAPEAPEAPLEVEVPVDEVDRPCGGTVSGEQEACKEQ